MCELFPPNAPRRQTSVSLLSAVAALALGLSYANRSGADEVASTDELRQPGLRAEYFLTTSLSQGKIPGAVITRQDLTPGLLLKETEAPDPRLPASGWKVRWSGVIEVLQPGQYRFSARSSGPLTLRIGQRAVIGYVPQLITGENAVREVAGQSIELSFGLHQIEIDFEQRGSGAELRLYWESEHFPREVLTSRHVGHAVPAEQVEAVAGVPIAAEVLLAADPHLAGRLSVEEHGCIACHRPSDTAPISRQLVARPGPRLTEAGGRLKPSWIYHWLGDPQSIRPEAVMPKVFPATPAGDVQRHAVALFLAEQKRTGDAPSEPEGSASRLAGEGKLLFERTGCIACHRSAENRPARATLRGLAEKTTAGHLAKFLENPAIVDPAGRMPNMKLSAAEALALACYLTGDEADKIKSLSLPPAPADEEIRAAWRDLGRDLPSLDRIPASQRVLELGRQVMLQRRCANCHEMAIAGEEEFWKQRPAKTDFAAMAARAAVEGQPSGCVAQTPPTASHPVYAAGLDRDVLRKFLSGATGSAGTASPAESAKLALARFNCRACHERDGVGGLAPEFVTLLGSNQPQLEAELLKPPTLTGIADKLLRPALEGVLTGDVRARPWMAIRMPHFGKQHVSSLTSELAALDGTRLVDPPPAANWDAELAEAGRQLVGAKGFGCTKCHDLLGRPSGGTRGPDLALVPERIQYDWFRHWMTDPQRIEPGTRMPTVFLKGESPYPTILDGQPARQREAIWQYLLASRDLPLPEGFEPDTTTTQHSDTELAVVRTFLPDVSPRSMAVRYPSGLHLVFDAQSCRLAYAWRGDFLDMTPVWTERGGRPARIHAPLRWHSPAGFPWDVAAIDNHAPADFTGRGTDPGWGAPLPDDAQLHPARVHFRGYQVAPDRPTFRYELDLADGHRARFSERLMTSAVESTGRIVRAIEIFTPASQRVTLNVAELPAPPQVVAPQDAAPQPLSLDSAEVTTLPTDHLIVAASEAGTSLYRVRTASPGASWKIAQRDGHAQVQFQFDTALIEANGSDQPQAAEAQGQLVMEIRLPTDSSPDGLARAIRALREEGGE